LPETGKETDLMAEIGRKSTTAHLAAMMLAAAVLVAAWAVPSAATEPLPEEALECLECHEDDSLEKELGNGEVLSLNVTEEGFLRSVHAELGCNGCHPDISLDEHPEERPIANREDYRARISGACEDCHEAPGEESQPHRYLISRTGAPACASCHVAHSIRDIAGWKASIDDRTYCLTCHRQKIGMTLDNGSPLSLSMRDDMLKDSVHLDHECTDCHSDFSRKSHSVRSFENEREHTVVLSKACRECHDEMYEQYEGSIHSSLIRKGNLAAPICVDCHGFHSVGPAETLATIAGMPCRRCHEEIFSAYENSMHGQSREKAGHLEAPICADCHQAHGVSAASWSERLRSACMACHAGVERLHDEWLPNSGRHLQSVACPSCHAPAASRRIDLVLFDRNTRMPVKSDDLNAMLKKGGITDRDIWTNGMSAVEMWKLVREANLGEDGSPVALVDQLDVRTGLEAHRMERKGDALRDCEVCHSMGAEAFENVMISMADSDGRIREYPAADKVLNSAVSVGPLGGFYALGSTRIRILDFLLILAVLGGMSVPALHGTARVMLKKK
jgi:hypothetical protein